MLRSRIFGCDGLSLKVKGSSRAANCGALWAKARGLGLERRRISVETCSSMHQYDFFGNLLAQKPFSNHAGTLGQS